ncbi:MAG: hypothetical protein Q9223_007841 [Gallowayella weberi]
MLHYHSHSTNLHEHSLQPQEGNYRSRGSFQVIGHESHPTTFTPLMTPPQRAVPNSGKRRKALDLSRSTPASSHHNKMSAIFEDASRILKTMPSPRLLSANARTVHMPLSTTKSIGNIAATSTPADDSIPDKEFTEKENAAPHDGCIPGSPTPLHPKSRLATEAQSSYPVCKGSSQIAFQVLGPSEEHHNPEPTSSGFNSPVGNPNRQDIVYPDLTQLLSSPARRWPATNMERKLPGGGLCSPTPAIETWLDQIHDDEPARMTEELDTPPARSHKNLSPSRTPIADQSLDPLFPRVPTRFAHPLTPDRGLRSPPKRKILRPSPSKAGSPAPPNNQDFVIYEDESSDKMAKLSPVVEKYRKGCGPKRKRCVSYWDEDILPEVQGKPVASERENAAREALRELPWLTKARGFVDGIENAAFDFEAGVERSE